MKNTILAIAFCFSAISAFAQRQFEGMWVCKESTYVNTIVASDYAILKVVNFSFAEHAVLEEEVVSQTDNEFKTRIYNKENGYEAFVKYSLSKDTLICKYSGDYNKTIKLNKLQLANKTQQSWVTNKNILP